MFDTPESHTIRLLQEMRAEIHELRAEMRQGFEDMRLRMDGMAHILVMLAAELRRHDERLARLEGRPGAGGG